MIWYLFNFSTENNAHKIVTKERAAGWSNSLMRQSWKIIKGILSYLRQFLATESPLKMIKNTFDFTSKGVFILKIFKFLFWLFGHVAKQLDKKDKINFKFCNFTAWFKNNRNTHIAQYFEKQRQSDNEIWSVQRG